MGDFEFTTSVSEVLLEDLLSNTSMVEALESPEQGFVVSLYSVLLVIGSVGNVAVFVSLVRSRRRKSRVNLLMTHLAVADLIVNFCVIPLEIGWRTTNAWLAGNYACKFFLVLRAFGLYLSSNILVCISIDRYFAVLHPLRLPVATKRSKIMLTMAWVFALLCSLPQSVVFRVMQHPHFPEFTQCVSFGAFANPTCELVYNMFCLCAMYFLPLTIISVCYACIFYEISKNSKEITDKCDQSDHSRIHLRRSDRRPLARARRRTLRMTVSIVTVFALCWLPYAFMTLWYMFHRKSAMHVSPRVQDLFFVMAVSNSCMDPLVYGSYTFGFKSIVRILKRIFCIKSAPEKPVLSGLPTLKSKVPTNEVALVETTNLRRPSSRHELKVQETSLIVPSVSSDPPPSWDHNCEVGPIRPSKSCELFIVHSQPSKRT